MSFKESPVQFISKYNSLICLVWYITYTWYISIWVLTIQAHGQNEPSKLSFSESLSKNSTYLLVFNSFVVLVAYSYYKTVMLDAGVVPDAFKVQQSDKDDIKERTREGKLRFCTHCNLFKPDRAHHCRKCNRCFLRMDHHCPWTNSCVGYYNYKFYMLLLFWGEIGLLFVLFSQWGTTGDAYYRTDKTWTDTWIVFNYICTIIMTISVTFLGLFHCGIIMKNVTTLEWMEKRRLNQVFVNIYDIGPTENWTQVFGPDPFLWFLPTRHGIPGDGVHFPTRGDDWLQRTV